MVSSLGYKLTCKTFRLINHDFNFRLNLEVVLHGIAIGFSGLETLLGIICIIMFVRNDKQKSA